MDIRRSFYDIIWIYLNIKKILVKKLGGIIMLYNDIMKDARAVIGKKCRVCKECNGIMCKGEIPGVGGKDTGEAFSNSYIKLKEIKINMDTIYEFKEVDTSIELFGKTFHYPIFAAPIGGLNLHYSEVLNDETYSKAITLGCKLGGTVGFTGDGVKDEFYELPLKAIKEVDGYGIPTIKPWKKDEILRKVRQAEEAGALAIAMDVDAAGLAILAAAGKPVSPKSVEELKEIISSTKLPFIIKGIMTAKGALKALEAGAYGIVVSNHGGRVLDQTPATVEVLPEIVKAVKGKMKIFIDGGIRTGIDVVKVLALGADAVLIGRPYAVAAYGGGAEGVQIYTEKIGKELRDTMIMTGCTKLSDIDETVIFKPSNS
ncbi:MAG: alpha-hydroxy-acid oxidizing protein [Clostridia bacterium]|jgi:isopentenyl diphosphate isomerase/L-lactate dehydrogenase-like FMN-dependent dehydrogenase|nr:alpha-hydroxy-acid oxidizing protein [Clostridia bacterium]